MNAEVVNAVAKKYPIILGCGVAALILIGLLYFRSGLLSEQRAARDSLSSEQTRYQQNVANAAQLQSQVDFLGDANRAALGRSLSAAVPAQNIQYFYRIESELGLKTIRLNYGSHQVPPAGKTYAPFHHDVGMEGSFIQAITFLRHLERGTYFCRINKASLSINGAVVTLNISLELLGSK